MIVLPCGVLSQRSGCSQPAQSVFVAHTLSITLICSLGKRKASELADQPVQDARNSKRPAVEAAAGTNQNLKESRKHLTANGNDTRGQKRTAETQGDPYQGVATQPGFRQPEPQLAADNSRGKFSNQLMSLL